MYVRLCTYILSMWGSLKLAPINRQPVQECLMLTTNTALALSGLFSSHLCLFSVNTNANSVDNCKCWWLQVLMTARVDDFNSWWLIYLSCLCPKSVLSGLGVETLLLTVLMLMTEMMLATDTCSSHLSCIRWQCCIHTHRHRSCQTTSYVIWYISHVWGKLMLTSITIT